MHKKITYYSEANTAQLSSEINSDVDSENESEDEESKEKSENSKQNLKTKENKEYVHLQELEYLETKKPTSKPRREFSLEVLEKWSQIGKNYTAEGVEICESSDQRRCQFCKYSCVKRTTMMKHVNMKHWHGHERSKSFVTSDK